MADLLLDTNTLISHLRKRASVSAFLLGWGRRDNLFISVITRTEILAGMRPNEERATLELLVSLSSLPITSEVADHAGRLIYAAARKGIQTSFPDALIAATALAHDLVVVTTNVRHFEELGVSVRSISGA
jgi:hypothetical protein